MSARVDVHSFDADHLPAAGRLLARRHRAHLAVEPLLSRAFAEPARAEEAVRAVFETEGASGVVAIADGEVTGYLLGAPKPDLTWGPNLWIESAGFAVIDAESMRDLYAAAAARWVDEGRTTHYALVPAYDPAIIDAWSRLAFGQQHLHGIREAPTGPYPVHGGLVIRRAARDDISSLAALEVALPHHQGLSPVFSGGQIPTLESALSEWEDDFDDPDYAVFVAEASGVVIGSAIGCSVEKSGTHRELARPDSAGHLGFVAVFPEHRGIGAGRALGEAVLWWAAEQGYPCVVTDWRVTNLLSSRTWPKLGFRPTFVRMHRVIGY